MSAALREAEVALMVETREPEAAAAVLQTITASGYEARPFTFGQRSKQLGCAT
jgi:hypothetical protein